MHEIVLAVRTNQYVDLRIYQMMVALDQLTAQTLTTTVEELLQVQDYLNMYKNRLHEFMLSLDNLANARLSSTLVDPVNLERYLKATEQDVADTTLEWELALPDIALYYAEPIIMYSNTPELLVLQIPIFLKQQNQVPMSLYWEHTAQVPMNWKTYENNDTQFTQIEVHQPYLAVRPNTYFAMHEPELRLCVKVQQWYMCETAKLQHTVQVHTCVSAIFYQQDAEIKAAQCVANISKMKNHIQRFWMLDTSWCCHNCQHHGIWIVKEHEDWSNTRQQPMQW